MDLASAVLPSIFARLPRVSGDGPLDARLDARAQLAAPRERGWTGIVYNAAAVVTGCPA